MQHQSHASEAPVLDIFELVATVLIALTAILTAWAAYQHSNWNGEQAKASRDASAAGLRATQASATADAQRSIDVGTFLSWLTAAKSDIDSGAVQVGDSGYVADLRRCPASSRCGFAPSSSPPSTPGLRRGRS